MHQAPCPPKGHTTMYSVTIKNWGPEGQSLRSDDLTSHAGAYLKALFYSKFYDHGLSDPPDCPNDEVKCHVVPYPSCIGPPISLRTQALLWRTCLATNRLVCPIVCPWPPISMVRYNGGGGTPATAAEV
jgi:hypothetical protein